MSKIKLKIDPYQGFNFELRGISANNSTYELDALNKNVWNPNSRFFVFARGQYKLNYFSFRC